MIDSAIFSSLPIHVSPYVKPGTVIMCEQDGEDSLLVGYRDYLRLAFPNWVDRQYHIRDKLIGSYTHYDPRRVR